MKNEILNSNYFNLQVCENFGRNIRKWFSKHSVIFSDDPFWFNLALNRTVTQSTTATDGKAEKAVDGIATPGYCAKTDGTSIPYLIIDLGEELFPTYIRLQLNPEIKPDVYPDLIIRFGKFYFSPNFLTGFVSRLFHV